MKTIIVAPRSMHKGLLEKIRKSNPFDDTKLYTKEELVRDSFGCFANESIAYLIKKHNLTYNTAVEFIGLMPFLFEGTTPKIDYLLSLKKELLDQDFYSRNSYLKETFFNKKVHVYGYSTRDRYLNQIFERVDVQPLYHIDLTPLKPMKVSSYESVEEEVLGVLNEICLLIDKGISPNDIYLFGADDTYDYYLKTFGEFFNVKINNLPKNTMDLTAFSNLFLKRYEETKDYKGSYFDEEELKLEDNVIYQDFKRVLDDSYDEEFSYEQQRDYLLSRLKRKKIRNPYYKNAVSVIEEPIYVENKYIFVLGFALTRFPRVQKDISYIPDVQKSGTNLMTSEDENACELEVLTSFLNSNNTFFYSFASHSIGEKYHVSPLIKDPRKQIIKVELPRILYSDFVAKYYLANEIDNYRNFKIYSPLIDGLNDIVSLPENKYDSSFSGVNAFSDDTTLEHSYTSINSYYECPFHYYLTHGLKIDEYESTLDAILGIVFHQTLEHVYDENFDFDKAFEEAKKDLSSSNKKYVLTKKDEVFLSLCAQRVKRIVKYLREHFEESMENPIAYSEEKLTYAINKNTTLVGKSDSIIVLNNQYYVDIDYKLYGKTFDKTYINSGIGLQLPTYALMLSEDKRFKDLKPFGVYYQQLINKVIIDPTVDSEGNTYPDFLKLKGLTIFDVGDFSMFDKTLRNSNKSRYVSSYSFTDDNKLSGKSKAVSLNEFNEIVSTTKEKIIEADKNIRNNVFPISPYYINDNLNGCKYCPFRDVCFHQGNKYRFLNKKEED